MEKLSLWVVKNKTIIIICFVILTVASAVCIPFITINYDDTFYLPDSSATKKGLSVMQGEFGRGGTSLALFKDKETGKILEAKGHISRTEGVSKVIWLDDIILSLLKDSTSGLDDYRKVDYFIRAVNSLPKNSNATGTDILTALTREFGEEHIYEVISLFSGIAEGVFDFTDTTSLDKPLGLKYTVLVSSLDSQVEKFYMDKNALFTITFEEDDYSPKTYKAIDDISAISDDLYLSGNSASAYYMQQNQLTEIFNATILVALITIVVMLVFSTSWFDPVIYLITIAVAIVLNMGSNIIFENVSYLTESIAAALQLALTMDYAVFLLNRYKKERKEGLFPKEAMVKSLTASFSAISASSLTTIACFVTIMFMKFKLGLDMGLVMGKGILLSLFTVFLLLPGVVILCDRVIMSTEHKAINFTAKKFSGLICKYRFVVVILAFAVIIPCGIFANKNTFVYGSKATQSPESRGIVNRNLIEETFGPQESLAVLVPKDDKKEVKLADSLLSIDEVTDVNSYAYLKNKGFEMLFPDSMKSSLLGSNSYNRIVLTLDCEEEGKETKALINEIRQEIENVYGSDTDYYLLGNTAAAIDMENYTHKDFTRISAFSIIAVGLIVALTFRSLFIPIILVAVIEGAVWINMSIPYFMGQEMVFLGYMIISNILLGATIDYAILFATNYKEGRDKQTGLAETIRNAISHTLRPIIISGGIFTACGFILGAVSSFPTVRLLGESVMRGGICSVLLTITLTPALLAILDKIIFRKKKNKEKV